jgi:UDP-glucuronate 4-epimerase
MKILVTGGAGFIGAHVAQNLIARGDEVVIIDDFNDRYNPQLKEERLRHLVDPAVPVIRADIRDRAIVDKLFQDHAVDRVIHLAAWAAVQTSITNPYVYTSVNVDGTVNLLEAARQHNVQNFVFASSSSVYGGRVDVPFREGDNVTNPMSPYAATKVAGEILCATWHNLYAMPITCLRFFTVYGPWGRPEMAVFSFTEAIRHGQPIHMRGRNTSRDFTYVDDITAGVIAAIDKPQKNFSVFNLGHHEAVPLPRLIQAIEKNLGEQATIEEVPLPVGDLPQTLADISLAAEKLAYNPTVSIEEGVANFVAWYKDWYVPFSENKNA